MGNILAIHAPPENKEYWGDPNKDKHFHKFLNKALIGAQDHHMKRACCMGLVGDQPGSTTDTFGLQVPVKNVGIQGSNSLTKDKNNTALFANEADIKKKIEDFVAHEQNAKVAAKTASTLKRVTFGHLDDKACEIGTKKFRAPIHPISDGEATAVCDEFYGKFCKDHIKDTCIVNGKYDTTDPRCSNKDAAGAYIFPNTEFPDKELGAHVYPEDCSCINGKFGDSYNIGYNLFTKGDEYIHPLHYDSACKMNAVKNNAYATTLHRSINNKGLTFCENNLNLENVTNIEIGEMKMSNDCDVGEFQDETEGVSQQVKEDLENEAKAAANRAAQSNEEDDEDADGENDEDEEEDPSGMDEYLTTENLSIGGGLLLFICMCCCLLLIMMMMMK
jgi:hypothetical protein